MEGSNVFECSTDQKFCSTDQKFCCLNPHHFLFGLTKNEGQLNQIAIWLSRPPEKVGSVYKISMDLHWSVRKGKPSGPLLKCYSNNILINNPIPTFYQVSSMEYLSIY